MILVRKSEFADIAGISKAAVSKLVRTGRIPETEGRIDIDSDVCREYLAKKGVNVDETSRSEPASAPLPPGDRASIFDDTPGAFPPDSPAPASPQDEPPKSKTVSSVMKRRELETKKLEAEIRYKELQNAQIEGRVVGREVMVRGVWAPLETFLVRLQSEGAQTIGKTLHQLGGAGGTREEFIQTLRDELSSYIIPLKETIQDSLSLSSDGSD